MWEKLHPRVGVCVALCIVVIVVLCMFVLIVYCFFLLFLLCVHLCVLLCVLFVFFCTMVALVLWLL